MAVGKNTSRRSNQTPKGYSKMKARTQNMNICVRFFLCCLVFMLACAFLVSTLNPYRELNKLRAYYEDEIQEQERATIEQVDQKWREFNAIENDPEYLGVIARDMLHYHKPGEHVFRIEK